MEKSESNDANRVGQLIDLGAEIAGGIGAAVTGLLIAGPAGAVAGGAAGPTLTLALRRVASEVVQRALGRREQTRMGATLMFAAQKIRENQDKGRQVREDDFFQDQPGKRSAAEEIAEGVLIAVQREHEESKLRLFGNLLANLAFHPEFDRPHSNLLVRLAERLSYRQLCLLTAFCNQQCFKLRDHSYRGKQPPQVTAAEVALLQEVMDLYSRELINGGGDALLGLADVVPAKVRVQGPGVSLYLLMELWAVPVADVHPLVALLS